MPVNVVRSMVVDGGLCRVHELFDTVLTPSELFFQHDLNLWSLVEVRRD